MKYTKLKVIRTKELSDDIFELILDSRGMKFKPGDVITINHPINGVMESRPFFIASGIQEPWIRILIRINDGVLIDYLFNIKKHAMVKVNIEPFSIFPKLLTQDEKCIFIASGIGISPFLSYFSSFPSTKVSQLLYHIKSEGVNSDWLFKNHNAIIDMHIDNLINSMDVNKKDHYYLCGAENVIGIFENILKKKVHPKKLHVYKISS